MEAGKEKGAGRDCGKDEKVCWSEIHKIGPHLSQKLIVGVLADC